jgi:hypothetical protein
VTSVYDPVLKGDVNGERGNWGVTGNRLYRNTSSPGRISFKDVTTETGVREGFWGWGACAADFNNDGFIDLFHVNGFGRIPDEVVTSQLTTRYQQIYRQVAARFENTPSRLFINNGKGGFTDQASAWGIDTPSEGRGIVCFDHDRDGDIDIVVFDHSRGLQFFDNQRGAAEESRFLGVRVVGAPPNTDAIGARVQVMADIGQGRGMQTQLRLVEANSNFSSQNLPDLHFGLGSASKVRAIRVTWPDGSTLVCPDVEVNRFLVLDQRDGERACPAP